jgi:hypothetical protein
MPNIKLLIEETISIIKVGMCCKADLELDKVIRYEDILNMWNFHKLIVRPEYAPLPNFSLDVMRELGKYYKRYPLIKDSFTAHTDTNIDHVLMFALEDSDQVLFCFKSIRRLKQKINPYIRIFFPKANLDTKTFNLDYIPNKMIKILYFSKKLHNL